MNPRERSRSTTTGGAGELAAAAQERASAMVGAALVDDRAALALLAGGDAVRLALAGLAALLWVELHRPGGVDPVTAWEAAVRAEAKSRGE